METRLSLHDKHQITGHGPNGLEETLYKVTAQTYESDPFFENQLELLMVTPNQKFDSRTGTFQIKNVLTGATERIPVPALDKELLREIIEHGIYVRVNGEFDANGVHHKAGEFYPVGYDAVEDILRMAGARCKMTQNHSAPAIEVAEKYMHGENTNLEVSFQDDQIVVGRAGKQSEISRQRKFIIRKNEAGVPKIFAAVSGQYKKFAETLPIDVINQYNQLHDDALKIERWCVNHRLTTIQTEFPEWDEDRKELFDLPYEFKTGLRFENSSTAERAFHIYSTVSIGRAKDLPIYALNDLNGVVRDEIVRDYRAVHKGTAEPDKISICIELEKTLCLKRYKEYPKRLKEYADRIEDVHVEDVLEIAIKAMRLKDTTGSSISLKKQDMIKEEIFQKLGKEEKLPLFMVMMEIIETCGTADMDFLSIPQKELLRNCTLRCVFADYKDC